MLAEPIYFFYVYNLRPFGKRRRQAESVKHAQPKGKPRMIGTLDLNSQHSGRLKYFTLVVESTMVTAWRHGSPRWSFELFPRDDCPSAVCRVETASLPPTQVKP